jgi:tRNA pseudouridine38-40 synthase
MRYFMRISYDGTSYFGWQKQLISDNTVQTRLEQCLRVLLKEEIITMGCGRTDTGVHAQNFYLHFDYNNDIDVKDHIFHANRILPKSIVVHDLFKVRDDLHSRFNALERSYVYRLKLDKDPFDFHYFHYTFKQPAFNLDYLNNLATKILEANNFSSFCKTRGSAKTPYCVVTRSEWIYDTKQNCYEYHITANRFLRGMIRLLVGAMLNVMRGRITEQCFLDSLLAETPLSNAWSVDANGLILYGIKYDFTSKS